MKVQRQVDCVTSSMLQNCSLQNLTQLLISVTPYVVGFVKLKEFVMIPVYGVGGNGAISLTKCKKKVYGDMHQIVKLNCYHYVLLF